MDFAAAADAVSRVPGSWQPVWTQKPQEAEFEPYPNWVDPRIVATFEKAGAKMLYRHQLQAVEASRLGADVLITTSTNSGKSLGFQLPILQAGLESPFARALCIFPTKALGQDQVENLAKLAQDIAVRVAAYDGDTPRGQRSSVRKLAHVVCTNPDMLHVGILPTHDQWTGFLKSVRYIVLDEIQLYRGVFGGHVAAILQRLLRLCAWYHNTPQIIACSATIGNAVGHFRALTGRNPRLIDNDFGPKSERQLWFFAPKQLGDEGSAHRSANATTSDLMAALVQAGQTVLAFNGSRQGTELVLRYAKRQMSEDEADLLASYRGGYTATERRKIERALSKGEIRGVATTNALETGINIGKLDAVILNGYPGSRSSFFQQFGRAGRGRRGGLGVFVARQDPLEQHFLAHPEALLEEGTEEVRAATGNPFILRDQIRCASHERPISATELQQLHPHALEVAESMQDAGELALTAGHFYYTSVEPPAPTVNIRGVGGQLIRLIVGGEVLGTMEYWRAAFSAHPGAVYLHRGEAFLVLELDLERKVAFLEPFLGDYYTQPVLQSSLERASAMAESGPLSLAPCRVTVELAGYRKRALYQDTVLDVEPIEVPAQVLDTFALCLDLPAFDPLIPEELQIAAVHGVEHILHSMAPLIAHCDRSDLGCTWYPLTFETMRPAVYLFDKVPGGIGITSTLYERRLRLIEVAIQRLESCDCLQGCPRCLLRPDCESANDLLDKERTLAMLRDVRRTLEPS